MVKQIEFWNSNKISWFHIYTYICKYSTISGIAKLIFIFNQSANKSVHRNYTYVEVYYYMHKWYAENAFSYTIQFQFHIQLHRMNDAFRNSTINIKYSNWILCFVLHCYVSIFIDSNIHTRRSGILTIIHECSISQKYITVCHLCNIQYQKYAQHLIVWCCCQSLWRNISGIWTENILEFTLITENMAHILHQY